MKFRWHYTKKFVIALVLISSAENTYSQNPSDWGLNTLSARGFPPDYGPYNTHDLIIKAKYSSRNYKSAIANRIYYFNNASLSINQLDPLDYLRWNGSDSMYIIRDTSAMPFGAYPKKISIKGSTSNYLKDFDTDVDDNYIVLGDNKGNGWNPVN